MGLKKTLKRIFFGGDMEDITRSTCLSGMCYKRLTKTLTVRFKKNGAVYEYYNVDYGTYKYLYKAFSIGKFYNAFVKPYYNYKRILG